mmetsp:Transcript_20284/g.52737  ORF Transcript_20284/g.52737 Transcript_20284/m.52737 type:complete len:188 (-) Transcript_20284:326-889(-)
MPPWAPKVIGRQAMHQSRWGLFPAPAPSCKAQKGGLRTSVGTVEEQKAVPCRRDSKGGKRAESRVKQAMAARAAGALSAAQPLPGAALVMLILLLFHQSSSSSSSSGGDVSSSGDESGSEDGSEGSVGAADACYVWRTPTFTSVKGYQKHLAHHAEEVANDPTLSQVEEKTCVQCGRSQFLLASARA